MHFPFSDHRSFPFDGVTKLLSNFMYLSPQERVSGLYYGFQGLTDENNSVILGETIKFICNSGRCDSGRYDRGDSLAISGVLCASALRSAAQCCFVFLPSKFCAPSSILSI